MILWDFDLEIIDMMETMRSRDMVKVGDVM